MLTFKINFTHEWLPVRELYNRGVRPQDSKGFCF